VRRGRRGRVKREGMRWEERGWEEREGMGKRRKSGGPSADTPL